MKILFFILASLLSFSIHATSFDETNFKKEIITEIVDSYRPQIIARYGYDVNLTFSEIEAFNMFGGHDRSGALVIKVFKKALTNFSSLAIVSTTCHELGHILGEVTTERAGSTQYNSLDSVEGEADYFSGSCARKYFDKNIINPNYEKSPYCSSSDQGCHQAIHGSRDMFRAFTISYGFPEPNEADAAEKYYDDGYGINPSYPDPNCRILSMISGVLNHIRPSCWYNPYDRN